MHTVYNMHKQRILRDAASIGVAMLHSPILMEPQGATGNYRNRNGYANMKVRGGTTMCNLSKIGYKIKHE